ncbi:hypothetical protein [Candidatus Stoquefichus sp. SB1]|jgi:hypothetical protein|uniref:hypothetical protein n=1 Tax=Candidatus Stoquefichus sp. SB1 TaxID=1658109 RepID=UPI000A6603CE|nr:hypothetical protein [Candidatus Stoquefichus sp. SB1]
MMESKGTNFTTTFICIAMVLMSISILVSLTNYFSVFNILRAFCGIIIIFGYYLLTKEKKIGFIAMWLGTILYALILQILGPEGALISIFISSEFILNIFVTFAVINKLKNYA